MRKTRQFCLAKPFLGDRSERSTPRFLSDMFADMSRSYLPNQPGDPKQKRQFSPEQHDFVSGNRNRCFQEVFDRYTVKA